MSIILYLFITLVALNNSVASSGTDCNEAICASIVSKCTLLKSCECEIEPEGCSCCKKCFACLEYLQAECCNCVGLCPSSLNATETEAETVVAKSVVGEIPKPTPQLWDALMEGEDLLGRWKAFTFEVDVKGKKASVQETTMQEDFVTVNCTVAYLSSEMGDTKCEKSCHTMGATSYRWFSDGCCQCVGHGCVNYGVNEARCGFAPDNDLDDVLDYDSLSEEELRLLEAEYGLVEDAEDGGTSTPKKTVSSSDAMTEKKIPED